MSPCLSLVGGVFGWYCFGMFVPTLENLVAPYSLQEFWDKYWGKKPLLIQRKNIDYYKGLFELEDVERVVFTGVHTNIAKDGNRVPESHYIDTEGKPSRPAIFQRFASGHTLIMDQVQNCLEGIRLLGADMEKRIDSPVSTNAYLTPKESEGSGLHFDRHEIFVAQLHGKKRWRVYSPVVEAPLHELDEHLGYRLGLTEKSSPELLLDVELESGDLLYFPRGYPHAPETVGELSLHISIGCNVTTWYELMRHALDDFAVQNVGLRRCLPPGFLTRNWDPSAMETQLKAFASQFASNIDAEEALGRVSSNFYTRSPHRDTTLLGVPELDEIGLDTTIRHSPHYRMHCGTQFNRAYIHYGEKYRVWMPESTLPALQFVCKHREFVVRDIAGLDESGRLVLVRNLIKEGVLLNDSSF